VLLPSWRMPNRIRTHARRRFVLKFVVSASGFDETQAYTKDLEIKIAQLEEENERLRGHKV